MGKPRPDPNRAPDYTPLVKESKMFGLEDELYQKIKHLEEKLAGYDSQFSQIATHLGGDARDCDSEPKTLARFVIQEFDKLKQRDKKLCDMLEKVADVIGTC